MVEPVVPEGVVRIEATPAHRRGATVAQWIVVLLIAGLIAAAARVVSLFWPERAESEVGRGLLLFVGTVTLAALTLAWLIVVIQDLVKMTIEIGDEGIRVERLLGGFRARWAEVREVGVVPARGHVTVKTAHGNLTATARLLGAAPFAALVAALRAQAGPAVQAWTPWAAARRQLLLLTVPLIGMAFLLLIGQGLWRRRLPRLGRRPPRP